MVRCERKQGVCHVTRDPIQNTNTTGGVAIFRVQRRESKNSTRDDGTDGEVAHIFTLVVACLPCCCDLLGLRHNQTPTFSVSHTVDPSAVTMTSQPPELFLERLQRTVAAHPSQIAVGT
jgi:hypothetical protein